MSLKTCFRKCAAEPNQTTNMAQIFKTAYACLMCSQPNNMQLQLRSSGLHQHHKSSLLPKTSLIISSTKKLIKFGVLYNLFHPSLSKQPV